MTGSDLPDTREGRVTVSLNGPWHYQTDESGQGWAGELYSPETKIDSWPTMDLPINWYLTPLGDFSGMVWFAKEFTLPTEWARSLARLVFNAVDYRAHVWINGTYVGNHEGMFAPFGMYVGENVRWGQSNRLVVCVDSPTDTTPYCTPRDEMSKKYDNAEFRLVWATDLKLIKGHMIDSTNRPGGLTRSKQKGNSGGIWQGIELIVTRRYNIESIKITPRLVYRRQSPIGDGGQDKGEFEIYDNSALVGVKVAVYNASSSITTAEVALSITSADTVDALRGQSDPGQSPQGRTVKCRRVDLVPGLNMVTLFETLPHPNLWWCWDHGDPNLYEARVKVTGVDDPGAVDQVSDTFGIRDFRATDDGIWYLNGRRVFVRGMRYISSQWISETTPAQYEEDLRQMKSLNINAVRIGSHVENPLFYRLCDKMGIMVWQVFPMHFMYSDEDELIERAAPMIKEMGNLLYNRTSLVRWSVAKEPWGPGYARYDELGRNTPNNYGRLCHALLDALRSVDPIRPIHLGDYLGSVNFTPGSCQSIATDVNRVYLRPTVSEYANGGGCISRVALLRKMLDERDLWPPNWDVWSRNLFISQWFFNGYGYGKTLKDIESMTLESLVEETQAFARELVKEQVEFIRQNKYRPVGSMFYYWWNDPCPAILSMGVLDSDRCPNGSWEALQQTYTPVLVSFAWEKPQRILGLRKTYRVGDLFKAKVWVTSDLPRCVPDALLSWELLSPQDKRILQSKCPIALEERSWVADEVEWKISGSCGTYTLLGTIYGPRREVLSSNSWKFLVEGE